jgi:hypothetical protein
VDALPASVQQGILNGTVNLNDPATTLALLKLNAVVGVKGFFDSNGNLNSVGIECALCHSTVDNSLAPGIGHRLDGWANRDLNVGAIIGFAPNLQPIATLLHVNVATVLKVLNAWGPGKFDAELDLDGKGFQPNGTSAAALSPPAFGLAGINLHTYTGWGSIPYWNAFVAVLEMHGQGTFFDPRLDNAAQFPIAAANHFGHVVAPSRSGHARAARAAGLRAVAPGARAACGIVRPCGRGPRQGAVRRARGVLDVPRAADLHPARLESGSAQRGRGGQLRGRPLADAHVAHHSAGRVVDPPEGRLLPRRPVPDSAGRGPALQRGVPSGPDARRGERPRAVPALDIARTEIGEVP